MQTLKERALTYDQLLFNQERYSWFYLIRNLVQIRETFELRKGNCFTFSNFEFNVSLCRKNVVDLSLQINLLKTCIKSFNEFIILVFISFIFVDI